MPSRIRTCCAGSVGEQLAVDGVGDPSLETPQCFEWLLPFGSLASVVGASLGVEADLGDRGDVDHVGSSVGSRPATAGGGSARPKTRPVVRCRSRRRIGCGRRTGRCRRRRPGSGPRRRVRRREGRSGGTAGQHDGLELRGGLLDLGLDRYQLGELFGGDAPAVLPAMSRGRTVASIALARPVVMSRLAWPGSSSANNAWSRSTVWTRRRVSASRRSVRIRSASSSLSILRPRRFGVRPRRPRSSGRRGRRSCGCGRCRRAGPGQPAWPGHPRPARPPRATAERADGRCR